MQPRLIFYWPAWVSTGLLFLVLYLLLFFQAQYGDGVPMILMGTLGLVVSVIGLSLPETLNQHLPETLAEVE